MLTPRTTPDGMADHAKVDELVSTLRREAAQADPDPFDDAMVAAIAGLAELDALRRRLVRLARRA